MNQIALAPNPGTTLSQRKAEFDNARFVDVRNLASLHYKHPDGTPLLTYTQTLADREEVKRKILEFELANGFILNDGATMPGPTPTNGATQVPMSFTPPTQAAPAPGPSPMAMPGQTAMPSPVMPPSDGPKPSRRKINAAAGTAVAAPPAAPPPATAQVASFSPPQAAPPVASFTPPQAPAVASFTPPQAPAVPQAASFSNPASAVAGPAMPASVQTFDITPIMATLDQLGKGVSVAANNADQALNLCNEIKRNQMMIMGMLHHMYITSVDKGAPANLPEFLNFFQKYIPQSP